MIKNLNIFKTFSKLNEIKTNENNELNFNVLQKFNT